MKLPEYILSVLVRIHQRLYDFLLCKIGLLLIHY